MTRRLRVLALGSILTILGAILVAPQAAFASAPCFAASCDGLNPYSSTIVNGCGPFKTYGGRGGDAEHPQLITLLYSKTCHAAYFELDWFAGGSVPEGLRVFYQPQYSGPEQLSSGEPATDPQDPNVKNQAISDLLSWDYSMKGCYVYAPIWPADPEPVSSGDDDFCSGWY